MSDIRITYNPYAIETFVNVDGEFVREGSRLFRYLHTPLSYWVDRLFHELILYCNDDTVNMVFRGRQHDAELVEVALRSFMKHNNEYRVNLELDVSPGDYERIGALLDMCKDSKDNVCTQFLAHELRALNALLISEDNEGVCDILNCPDNRFFRTYQPDSFASNVDFTGSLSSDFFAYSDSCELPSDEIYHCINFYTACTTDSIVSNEQHLCEAIRSDYRPVVVVFVKDEVNNAFRGVLAELAEQYSINPHSARERLFIVTTSPLTILDAINRDFSIANPSIYSYDEIDKLICAIQNYRENTYWAHRLACVCSYAHDNVAQNDTRIALADEKKRLQDSVCNDLYRRAVELLTDGITVQSPNKEEYTRSRTAYTDSRLDALVSKMHDELSKIMIVNQYRSLKTILVWERK